MSVQYARIRRLTSRSQTDCALCGRYTTVPVLDHCHAHGFVRGLVCTSCNGRMGYVDAHTDKATDSERFYRDNCPDCRRVSGGLTVTPRPERFRDAIDRTKADMKRRGGTRKDRKAVPLMGQVQPWSPWQTDPRRTAAVLAQASVPLSWPQGVPHASRRDRECPGPGTTGQDTYNGYL